jgi:hypothetical protein
MQVTVNYLQTMRCHIPEDSNISLYRICVTSESLILKYIIDFTALYVHNIKTELHTQNNTS